MFQYFLQSVNDILKVWAGEPSLYATTTRPPWTYNKTTHVILKTINFGRLYQLIKLQIQWSKNFLQHNSCVLSDNLECHKQVLCRNYWYHAVQGIRDKVHPRMGHTLDLNLVLEGGWWSMPHADCFTAGKDTQFPRSVNPITQHMSFPGIVKHQCS